MDNSLYNYAQSGFLRELMFNNINNAKEVLALKKLLHININFNTVLIITVDNFYSLTFNKSELQKHKIRKMVMDVLERLATEYPFYVINTSEETFAVLVRIEQTGEDEILEGLRFGALVKERIQRETGYVVSVGAGRTYRDVLNIHLSYKEALSACSRKFFTPGGQVIHVSQVTPYAEDLEIFPEEIESDLVAKFLSGNPEALNILAKSISDTRINPLFIKTRLIDITMSLIKMAIKTGADVGRLSEIGANVIRIMAECDTVNDLSRVVEKTVESIRREVSATKKRLTVSSFESIVQHIHQNYHQPLTLEIVSNYVHLNPYYFSHGFKNYTGVNFIDYLTRIRMDEAKKLLVTNNYSIGEVAKRVGYRDPNYFTRVFRKNVGIPPGKYAFTQNA